MDNQQRIVAGVENGTGTIRFGRPTPAEQIAVFLQHGAEFDPDSLDEITHSMRFHHSIWWNTDKACKVRDGECGCGGMALMDVVTRFEEADNHELAVVAVQAHAAEVSRAWKHLWSGDSILFGGADIGDACALCIGEGLAHTAEVNDEARNLSVELCEAMAGHPWIQGLLLSGDR